MTVKLFIVFTLIILTMTAAIILYAKQFAEDKQKIDVNEDDNNEEYCTNPEHREIYLDLGRNIAEWRCVVCNKKAKDF